MPPKKKRSTPSVGARAGEKPYGGKGTGGRGKKNAGKRGRPSGSEKGVVQGAGKEDARRGGRKERNPRGEVSARGSTQNTVRRSPPRGIRDPAKKNAFPDTEIGSAEVPSVGIGDLLAPGSFDPAFLPELTGEMKLPELLVPCGSPDSLEAAVYGGADAVYCGGKLFNARLGAKNFDDEAMKDAILYCHKNGVRLYVTLNTLILDRELYDAAKYAERLYSLGADGLIIADAGLSAMLRELLPELPLHASTQMSACNLETARSFSEQGFSRVVLAREMSAADIFSVCSQSPIETEVFVHGALCVCRSGQCLMSSVVGGRSGNRGECAQPCRLPYNGGYPLSLKDLCLAGQVRSLIRCGISSLKIEGRMKSPAYIRGVAGIYRRLLDGRRDATEGELLELRELFSRGGFTDGYYTDRIGREMLGVRSGSDKSLTIGAAKRPAPPPCVLENAQIPARPAIIPAMKPGDTLAGMRLSAEHEPMPRSRSARFAFSGQIPDDAGKFFDIIALPPAEFIRNRKSGNGLANAVVLPAVVHDTGLEELSKQLGAAAELGALHCYVGNIGLIRMAGDCGLRLHGDFRLNIFNSASPLFYSGLAEFEDFILSPELILAQARDIRAQKTLIVYGRLPLMLLEKSCGTELLTDRRGASFPVIPESGGGKGRRRETIYNSCPVWMADKQGALSAAGISSFHFIFSTESRTQCSEVIAAYRQGRPPHPSQQIKRIK